jgi:hypothetical protein
MTSNPWPRKTRAPISWQHLSASEADSGKRWAVVWDTSRLSEAKSRNTALEPSERAALDRARHLLRMGFVVYELRDSTGMILLDEAGIKNRLGLKSVAAQVGDPSGDETASVAARDTDPNDNLARDMIDVHGNDAAGIARDNARTAAIAGRTEQVRKWLAVVDVIQRRQVASL